MNLFNLDIHKNVSSKALAITIQHYVEYASVCSSHIDWSNKELVKQLKNLHDKAAKAYNRMSNEDQGEFSELLKGK